MWENRDYEIRLKENTVRDFERVMLTSGQCSLFVPMVLIGDEAGEVACYDCSGFTPLSSYRVERTEDALYILEKTMVILAQSVEYLIAPARITLSTDTVFYNQETDEIKIAYIPLASDELSLRINILRFMAQLKKDIRDGKDDYLNRIAKYIYYHNYYIRDIINRIGIYKREIYILESRHKIQ